MSLGNRHWHTHAAHCGRTLISSYTSQSNHGRKTVVYFEKTIVDLRPLCLLACLLVCLFAGCNLTPVNFEITQEQWFSKIKLLIFKSTVLGLKLPIYKYIDPQSWDQRYSSVDLYQQHQQPQQANKQTNKRTNPKSSENHCFCVIYLWSQDCGSIPKFSRLFIHKDTFGPETVNLYIYTCGFKKRTGRCGGICAKTCRTAFHLRRDVEDLPPVSCLHHQWEKRMIKKLNCMFGGLYRVLGNAI